MPLWSHCSYITVWNFYQTMSLPVIVSPVDLKRARTWGEGPWLFDRTKFGTSCCKGRRVTKKRALSFSLSSRTFTFVLKSALSHALIWVTNENKILGDMAGICFFHTRYMHTKLISIAFQWVILLNFQVNQERVRIMNANNPRYDDTSGLLSRPINGASAPRIKIKIHKRCKHSSQSQCNKANHTI